MATIRSRLERLEAMAPKHITPPKFWVCHVRQGHEDQDRAVAFRAAGIEPADSDIIVQSVHHHPVDWPNGEAPPATPLARSQPGRSA